MVRNLETPACHRTPTSHFPLPTSHFPLPTSHFPLPTSHFPLPTSHFLLPTSYFPLPTSHFPLPTSHFPRPTSHVPRPSRSDIFCHRGRRRSSFRAKRCEFGSFHDFSSPPPPTPSSIWPQWRHEWPAPRPSPLGAIAPRCGTPGFGDHARRGRGLAVPAG